MSGERKGSEEDLQTKHRNITMMDKRNDEPRGDIVELPGSPLGLRHRARSVYLQVSTSRSTPKDIWGIWKGEELSEMGSNLHHFKFSNGQQTDVRTT